MNGVSVRVSAWKGIAVGVLGVAAAGCSSKASLVGAGGSCEQATDCAAGLICEPQKSGGSICSSDLSGVQQLPSSPDAGGGAAKDAAAPVTDTGAPMPQPDSGAPQTDSATPQPDAGSPPPADAATE